MKKTFHLSLVACALAGIAALAVSARADFRLEKTLKLASGGEFVLDSDEGSVSVLGTRASEAKVLITSDRDDINDLFTFSFDESPGSARVSARKTVRFGRSKNLHLRFEIEVPTNTRLSIRTGGGSIQASALRGEEQLETSGGSIEISSVAGGVRAHTSGGHLALREVTGDAHIETSGGGIEVASLDGSLNAHTSGGPIRIEGVTGHVDAHTSGGSVQAKFARGNTQGGTLETSGGSIRVALDPAANLDVDASTSGGSVSSDLPLRVVGRISGSSLHGSLGKGGETLRLHTSGGSIHIGSL